MRYSVSWSQGCTVAIGKVTEMTTGIWEIANQRVKIARQLYGDYPNQMIFWWNLDISYSRKMQWNLDSMKVVDILAMVFTSILQEVSQCHLRIMNLRETLVQQDSKNCPWARDNGFIHSHLHVILLGKLRTFFFLSCFKKMELLRKC